MLDIPGSELCFWGKKLGVQRAKGEVPSSEVGVPSRKLDSSSFEVEGWGSEGNRTVVERLVKHLCLKGLDPGEVALTGYLNGRRHF